MLTLSTLKKDKGFTVLFILNLSLFFTLFFTPLPVVAFCFEEAGAIYGISPQLLRAIAKVESNFVHSAINRNSNKTYDFGLMQINSSWYKVLGHDIWMSIGDPCQNVKLGAWILAQNIQKYGYTWEAVGYYNSTKSSKRKQYIKKVYSALVQQRKSKSHEVR